ncbi:uncharacterized protein LOC129749805 [Uranotaenia lowii]|uniref:uncharacterized protein LOC129749805 n=1 Tax=Uranotaenia lowii TaxID=190385 RepID=UPI0024783CB9|nr:uncharacterized protein LOC129749805 [Uranotaenia lowii]
MHDLLINVSSDQNICVLINLLIDYLLEVPKQETTKTKLASLLTVSGTGNDDIGFTLKLVENLFRQYCLNEISQAELRSHFGNLSPQMQTQLLEGLDRRRPEIDLHLINEVNARDGLLMESFDWDVKWIMGSSSLASVREQIATMALNCRTGKDMRLRTVRFEMTRAKIDDMIRVLEGCSTGC